VNEYEQKRLARIARLRARAAQLKAAAERTLHRHDQLLACMNGTPILIGHHSEGRHRRDIARINRAMEKSFEMAREAGEIEARAANAEENPAISSDDPEAVVKLREQIVEREALQSKMVAANAALRKGDDVALAAIIGERAIPDFKKPDFCGRVGFADYEMKNNGAEIRRLRKRIEAMTRQAARPPRAPEDIGPVRLVEQDNRLQVVFPGKPPAEVRAELKAHGFRYAPSVGAWQRMPSYDAWYWARKIAESIAQASR